jgi:hypothetical protein
MWWRVSRQGTEVGNRLSAVSFQLLDETCQLLLDFDNSILSLTDHSLFLLIAESRWLKIERDPLYFPSFFSFLLANNLLMRACRSRVRG